MRERQGARFDNLEFWEERYRTNIALGSGGGSRGDALRFKRELLTSLLERLQPRTVLDIGCGDIEVTRDLALTGAYTGIDISPYVIERNRALRPDWEFRQGDFVAMAREEALQADLVLCFDVLIHQHDRETYRAFVRELLRSSRVALVVNGFETFPPSGRMSPNVAYHEPLSQTLREAGAAEIEPLATFRRMLIALVPAAAPGGQGPG